MSWLKKANDDPFAIYQSPDFPHVFLGGGIEEDDMTKVEQMAGQPICMRINLSSSDTVFETKKYEKADMRIPLPDDPDSLPEELKPQWQDIFNRTVDQAARIIENTQCPIYFHCALGANRSVSVLASALSQLTGRPFEQIVSEMKSIRQVVHPHEQYISWGNQLNNRVPTHILPQQSSHANQNQNQNAIM